MKRVESRSLVSSVVVILYIFGVGRDGMDKRLEGISGIRNQEWRLHYICVCCVTLPGECYFQITITILLIASMISWLAYTTSTPCEFSAAFSATPSGTHQGRPFPEDLSLYGVSGFIFLFCNGTPGYVQL